VLSGLSLPATMRCIMSMNELCSRSVKLPSVARWAARAEVSILARSVAPAGVNLQSRARRSSSLTALSTSLRVASRFNAPVVVAEDDAALVPSKSGCRFLVPAALRTLEFHRVAMAALRASVLAKVAFNHSPLVAPNEEECVSQPQCALRRAATSGPFPFAR
jgi:hypothetical protein